MDDLLHTPPEALIPGPARDALAQALHALEATERRDTPPANRMHALADVARAYRALGALTHAESYLEQALRWSRSLGASDASVDLLCDLAELAVHRADQLAAEHPRAAHRARELARDHGFEAAALASRAADSHWEVHVLLRISDALDRCGDHDDAIALQCRALHLLVKDELPVLDLATARAGQSLM
jgi:tetratricopeptide (TPR) repeat protein